MVIRVAIIVCGSRDFNDYYELSRVLDNVIRPLIVELGYSITIIEGEASGADSLARSYAIERSLNLVKCPADWRTHGKSAGYLRNLYMAELALESYDKVLVVAFNKNHSRGTSMMIEIAQGKSIPVIEMNY